MKRQNVEQCFFVTVMLLSIGTACGTETNDIERQVEALGEEVGQPIESGFFFINGRYIESPYRVSRRGLAVCINGYVVVPPLIEWPPPDLDVDKDPGVPTNLTANSTFADLERSPTANPHDAPLYRKMRYVNQHRKGEEVVLAKMAWFESLPFVASVRRLGRTQIEVRTKQGEVLAMWVGPESLLGFQGTPKKETIIPEVNRRRERLEETLRDGNCLIIFTAGGHITMNDATARERLPQMFQALSSSLSRELKMARLEEIGITSPRGKAESQTLVETFSATPQLMERLKALDGTPARGQIPKFTEKEMIELRKKAEGERQPKREK
jgi:hypothetical protein